MSAVPSIDDLVAEHWQMPDSRALFELIRSYHPSATVAEVVAALRQQAAAAGREADALMRSRPPAANDA